VRASILAGLALFSAVATQPAVAAACPSSSTSEMRLLGVDPDGNAVRYRESWGENADMTWRTFIATDKNGTQIASVSLEGETLTTEDPSGYFEGLSRLPALDQGVFETAIIRQKKLTRPTKKRSVRHVASEAKCGSIEMETKSGWLRVAEVGVLSYQFEESCPPLHLEALEHEQSDVIFVRVRYQLGTKPQGDDYSTFETTDDVLLLPESRVRAAELAIPGARARTRGKLDEAVPLLEEAIRLSPQLMPARSSLIRAYARTKRDWTDLEALLDTPIGDDAARIGAGPTSELLGLAARTWTEAADRETSWPWQLGQEPSLRASFL